MLEIKQMISAFKFQLNILKKQKDNGNYINTLI